MNQTALCRGCRTDRGVQLHPFCSFCAQMWKLDADTTAAALESDNPTLRLLARQGLRYKAQRDAFLHLLERWNNRWLPDGETGSGEFDTSEPGFSDLLDQTERALYGEDVTQTAVPEKKFAAMVEK